MPSAIPQVGAGTGATANAVGSDFSGYITVTVGAGAASGYPLVSLAFSNTYITNGLPVWLQPIDSVTAALVVTVSAGFGSPMGFQIVTDAALGPSMPAGTTYSWFYGVF